MPSAANRSRQSRIVFRETARSRASAEPLSASPLATTAISLVRTGVTFLPMTPACGHGAVSGIHVARHQLVPMSATGHARFPRRKGDRSFVQTQRGSHPRVKPRVRTAAMSTPNSNIAFRTYPHP